MHEIVTNRLVSGFTYMTTFLGIWTNFDSFKSVILFIGALVLLYLQIRLHLLKLKNEKKNK